MSTSASATYRSSLTYPISKGTPLHLEGNLRPKTACLIVLQLKPTSSSRGTLLESEHANGSMPFLCYDYPYLMPDIRRPYSFKSLLHGIHQTSGRTTSAENCHQQAVNERSGMPKAMENSNRLFSKHEVREGVSLGNGYAGRRAAHFRRRRHTSGSMLFPAIIQSEPSCTTKLAAWRGFQGVLASSVQFVPSAEYQTSLRLPPLT